jgi:hypothetical protein
MSTVNERSVALARLTDAIPGQIWTFAKTMPWIPHEYALRERWNDGPGLTFTEAVEIVRTYGYEDRFGKRTFVYLNIGEWKYWTMGNPIEQTRVLNRAPIVRQRKPV